MVMGSVNVKHQVKWGRCSGGWGSYKDMKVRSKMWVVPPGWRPVQAASVTLDRIRHPALIWGVLGLLAALLLHLGRWTGICVQMEFATKQPARLSSPLPNRWLPPFSGSSGCFLTLCWMITGGVWSPSCRYVFWFFQTSGGLSDWPHWRISPLPLDCRIHGKRLELFLSRDEFLPWGQWSLSFRSPYLHSPLQSFGRVRRNFL